jgi:hypothetical protein
MTKQKILLAIPLVIIASLLIYTWSSILFGDNYANWQHVVGLLLFIIPAVLFFKNFKLSVLTSACFLVFGTFNLLGVTPWISSTFYWIEFKPVKIVTPSLQLVSFGLLILFCIINFQTLVNIYLDYKGYKDEQAQDKPI